MSEARDIVVSATLERLVETVGVEATQRLVLRFGGTRITIPTSVERPSKLREVIGAAALAALIREVGHGALDLPTGRGRAHGRRIDRGRARRLRAEGWSVARIARALGCTERQVYNILGAAQDTQLTLFDLAD